MRKLLFFYDCFPQFFRYLQASACKIEKKNLQLVGVAAMLVASKYEEMYAPEIGDFVYITDNAYTEKQIRKMEIEILGVLGFDLGRPLPLHFLRRNSKAGGVDALTHTLVSFFFFSGKSFLENLFYV